ncbi:MAG: hypothetical protein E8D41_09945 [Nitrospira sp.]|nr:MAG: hypothetical protein E8D41_09945 [Nitrospira sp.]
MSRALKAIVERLGAQTGVLCCAVLLDLPVRHPLCDGLDAAGRSVFLIGRHSLGSDAPADVAVEYILGQLKDGHYPDVVHPVLFAPKASLAMAAAIDGDMEEILAYGERGTGKTHLLAGAALINAELHHRGQYPGVFKVMWLHDSLMSASAKTGEALELPMWGGLWSIKDDRTKAIFSIGGKEVLLGNFVGCKDASSAERLRQDCHMVVGEELVASLTDGLGIELPQWRLAISSSIRLETRHRVAMAATNPGSPDLWPYAHFDVAGQGHPTRRAIHIPISDRLSPEQQAVHRKTFAGNSAMDARLGRGEWVMAERGQPVAEGFNAAIHVSRWPLTPHPQYLLGIGWDGGHSPSAVIGQRQGGPIQVFAALNGLGIGTLELIEQQVRPWIDQHAPWALLDGGAALVHCIDPNLSTPGQATIHETAEKMILKCLGGRIVKGAVRWAPRKEAVLKVLAPRHEAGQSPLLIAPGPDTALLVQAFEGRWFYPITTDGQVDRTGPKKPNSPFADLGDAAAYLFGWLLGSDLMEVPTPGPLKVETSFSLDPIPMVESTFDLGVFTEHR